MTTTTTTYRRAVEADYDWLPPIAQLNAVPIDPAGLPPALVELVDVLNERTIRGRGLRAEYEAMTKLAFLDTIAADEHADAQAIASGTPNAVPTNTGGDFLERRRQLRHDADTWIRSANQAAHNVNTWLGDNLAAAIEDVRPAGLSFSTPLKASRMAVDKLRPAMAALDHADAVGEWLVALSRSVNDQNAQAGSKPSPDTTGMRVAHLDGVLRALDELTP